MTDAHGFLHLVPSPDGMHLATVVRHAPTTLWITSFQTEPYMLGVFVHHAPVKHIEWSRQHPHSLLIQCATTAESLSNSLPSTVPMYLWSSLEPAVPRVIDVPIPTNMTSAKSGQSANPSLVSATWLACDLSEGIETQLLVSGSGACTIASINGRPYQPLNDSDTVILNGQNPRFDVGTRALGEGDMAADDTFAFRKR